LRIALERADECRWHLHGGFRLLDGGDRLAERDAWREIERQRHRRELALMVDGKNGGRLRRLLDERAQRDLRIGERRGDVQLAECLGRALSLRVQLEDDVIAVEVGEILRHLALPERIVERVVDQLRRYPEPRRLVAIDGQGDRRSIVLLVGRDIGQLG
jgi:hypothetical protein